MPQALPDSLKDEAKTMFLSGYQAKQIAESLGVKRCTIYKWNTQGDWTGTRAKVKAKAVESVRQAVVMSAEQASREAKNRLSDVIMSHTAVLRDNPGDSIDDLRNTPDGEGRASLVKRIAETASMVYGWDNEKGNSLIVVGLIDRLDPDNQVSTVQEPAIDVESSPSPSGQQ